MDNEMRLIKFEGLIDNLDDKILGSGFFSSMGRGLRNFNGLKCDNTTMLLIYDYDKLNEYGKIILDKSSVSKGTNYGNYKIEDLKDMKTRIKASKDLIEYFKNDRYGEKYKFIFWALMVLTVDKTDKEEKLTLICDFARMLDISDDGVVDIVYIIKNIYKEDTDYKFKTTIPDDIFSRVLKSYY